MVLFYPSSTLLKNSRKMHFMPVIIHEQCFNMFRCLLKLEKNIILVLVTCDISHLIFVPSFGPPPKLPPWIITMAISEFLLLEVQ